ncbi:hypothetical protein [Leifsonia poae]|uniref:Uncharacterized protein n=1 Tax=Leifsonia poae TaxID=110933 RepID=A0A9W6M0R6_9MICO|nr:hypothetical protein [Leifsonia poae]GLJ76949.1 hypothetical protein GCM10017584_25230 [Leifsonia poae]
MRNRSQPEWLSGTDAEADAAAQAAAEFGSMSIAAGLIAAEFAEPDDVLPAVSTSGSAFQAILDDLVKTVGDDELAASVASGSVAAQPDLPVPPVSPAAPAVGGLTAADEWPATVAESTPPVAVPAPAVAAPAAPVAPPPALLRGRGDLTLVIGLGTDALTAARMLAEAIGDAEVRPGGCSRAAAPRVDDRRGALRARADGVRRERPIVAAFGVAGGAEQVAGLAEALASIAPDQVWAAVDVSRKTEDTAAWVRAVDGILAVDALVVSGSAFTATPSSARGLGIPIGWLDGSPVGGAPVGIG